MIKYLINFTFVSIRQKILQIESRLVYPWTVTKVSLRYGINVKKIEDTKVVIKRCILKDKQCNGRKKNNKKINKGLHNNT